MRQWNSISAAALAAVISLAASVSANEPCKTCGNGVTPTLAPKPACDNKIYPLSEYHYYKRYCGPVVSPNATYGYFQTQWRQWDGNLGHANANCAATKVETTPTAPAPTLTPAPTPAPAPPTSTDPKILPKSPSIPPASKESIPAPKPSSRGRAMINRIGLAGPVSPGVYLISDGK